MAKTEKQQKQEISKETKTMLGLWLNKINNKNPYGLSNKIKDDIIIKYGTDFKSTQIIKCQSIIDMLLIDNVKFLVENQIGIKIKYDVKSLLIEIDDCKNIENKLTAKQMRFYNLTYGTDFNPSKEKIKTEEEEQNRQAEEELKRIEDTLQSAVNFTY